MAGKERLVEIRLHGRGGHGVVFAAAALAEAAYREGKNVQAFGIYGAERRGAPVTAYVRVGTAREMPRCQIQRPDIVVAFDTKLQRDQVTRGLKAGGLLLVNAPEGKVPLDLCSGRNFRVVTVNASGIAAKNGLGVVGIPVINTVILGALARVSGVCSLASMLEVIKEKIPSSAEKNLAAAREGFDGVRELVCHAMAL